MIGQTLGSYRIVERLGEGGMGTVYRAVDEMLDREVAIKVLRPELARQAALVERFREEARALARLGHPRIATLHGLQRHGDELLMIMEFVRGDTLETIVERTGRIAWPRAAELCIAVLDALDHAHDKQIVHRDIKPANVMLAHTGAVKVMDFGIARVLGRTRQTQAGHAVGTPTYMAPEQLRGEEVDRRTDLYAVGAMLFELITGRMAFEAESDYRLMMMQLNEAPPPPSRLVADVPPAIDAIVGRAMAKARADRFHDATAFADALREASREALAPRAHRATPIAVPLTRLETPRVDPPAPGATASQPVSSATVGEPVATRLAAPSAPSAPSAAWPRDWRVWAATGTVLVAAGVGAMVLRRGPADEPAPVAARTTGVPARPSIDSAAGIVGGGAPVSRGEDAQSLIINPPALRADVPVAPATPAAPTPRPPASAPTRTPRQVAEVPAPVAHPTVAPPPAESRPVEREARPAPRASDAEARSAIQAAIGDAATLLSGRIPSAAESLIGGEARAPWTALMREGRISLAVDGAPTVQLDGDNASASFDATVNVRSPFGANRKRPARFAAELQRSGERWVVRTIRPVGALSLP